MVLSGVSYKVNEDIFSLGKAEALRQKQTNKQKRSTEEQRKACEQGEKRKNSFCSQRHKPHTLLTKANTAIFQ